MTPMTQACVDRAELAYGTVDVLHRQMRVRIAPEQVCFHAQLCVWQYRTARLVEAGLPVPRTRRSAVLARRLAGVAPTWAGHADRLSAIDTLTADITCPGASATRADAGWAVALCRDWRSRVRASLGL